MYVWDDSIEEWVDDDGNENDNDVSIPPPPVELPTTPTLTTPTTPTVPDTGGWTTDELGNKYKIDSNGNLTFKDAKGTDYTYNTAKGGFTDAAGDLAGKGVVSGLLNKINTALGTKFSISDLGKLAVGAGGLAGALGAFAATTKPTGYQGGIPQLTASQPMLTEPPPGRRPGSGGINYGTGVQYKDAKGNIVSDTSTSIADLYKKATQKGTYNNWGHQYGNVVTPVAPKPFTFTPAPPHTSVAPPPPPPPSGGGIVNLPIGATTPAPSGSSNSNVNNGIATGIDVNRPWAKASSDPTIKAVQDALNQLSKTQGTPEQRQAALTNFLKTTKYTPAQLAAAANGQWGIQDLINQMQGNTNVFNTQTPWSIYSTQADTKAVQDALQQLSQTKGTPEERQTALTNFLKTTKYTPAQLAAASNGMWSVADLTAQMAGNPVLQQASNAPAASAPTGGGFVTGGGETSKADYDRAVATETARRNAEQAKLDAFHIDPSSRFYQYQQNLASIPHLYGETDAQAFNRMKQQAMDETQQINNRASQATANPNSQFVVTNPGGGTEAYGTPQTVDPTEYARLLAAHDAEVAKSMAGNQFTTGGGSPTPVTPNPFVTGEQPALSGLAALQDAAQKTYGRQLTDFEQQDLSGKSLEDAQGIMQQSMDSWKAAHPQGMAAGGLTNLDHGGFVIPADVVSHFGNGSSSAGLELLAQNMGAKSIKGDGDGMSDSIPAAIDGREKALVANEEAYLSPQMVERLGDGNMDAGSRKLKQMMEKIRQARTGSKEQGKQINPNNFMPGGTVGYAQGGGIKSYAGTDPTGSLVQTGVTGTEQNLSNWVGPYATNMLGQAQALSNTPYQAYTGPLTAGASGLQNQAFQNAGNLSVPSGVDYAGQQMAQIGDQAQKSSYDPATFGNQFQAPTPYQNTNFTSGTFDSGAAQQYMNPYLQQSLNPQLDEARRQSEITAQQNNAAMTKAGAFGGGRQAILNSENQRNLGTNQANITGQGYNTAYTNAMSQFNQDQARNLQAQQLSEQSKQFGAGQGMTAAQMAAQYGLAGQQAGEQSRQYGANYGIQGLNTALQSAQGLGNLGIASGGLSLQNLNTQAGLGATQRGIESEGIAADKAQFEEARKDPYTKLQFQQSMLNGMPITATNYNMSQPSAFTSGAQGATTLAQLLKILGLGG